MEERSWFSGNWKALDVSEWLGGRHCERVIVSGMRMCCVWVGGEQFLDSVVWY